MPSLALHATVTAASLLVRAALGSFRKPPQALRGSMLAENFALDASLVEGGSLARLVAIVASKLPGGVRRCGCDAIGRKVRVPR